MITIRQQVYVWACNLHPKEFCASDVAKEFSISIGGASSAMYSMTNDGRLECTRPFKNKSHPAFYRATLNAHEPRPGPVGPVGPHKKHLAPPGTHIENFRLIRFEEEEET